MKGEERFITNLLEGSKTRFIIPVYQRNYDWKTEQCKRLFEDIEEVARGSRETHFFGSIVSKAEQDARIVIDGQQRITTTFLLLLALVHQVNRGYIAAFDSRLPEMLTEWYLADKFHQDDRKLKLKLIKDDQRAFEAIFFEAEEALIADSNVTQNYLYFCERIKSTDLSADELHEAINRLMVIDIKLDKNDDAQLIFESLNSTGLDLSEGDKIRNFILMGLDSEIQDTYYEKYWNKIEVFTSYDVSSFVRDYLAAKRRQTPAIRKVYSVFREYVKNDALQTEALLEELLKYSKHYAVLRNADSGNNKIDAVLYRLGLLDVSVVNPFLLNLLEFRAKGQINDFEVTKALESVEIYIFRRWVCKVPTNALNKVFETLHSEIIRGLADGDSYSDALSYILLSKDGSSRLPDDREFMDSFSSRDFYHIQNNKFYLYDRLENSDSFERVNVVKGLQDEIYTIEHIMPQTLSKRWIADLGEEYNRIHDVWLNNLANLTLTGYNTSYSNKRFEEKRDIENGFKDSGLRINQSISECKQWGLNELQQRSAQLWLQFLELWPMPKTSYEPKVDPHEEYSLDADFDFTNRKIAAYTFMGSRFTAKSWVDMILSVLSLIGELDPVSLMSYIPEGKFPASYFFGEEGDYRFRISNGLYFNPASSTETKTEILKKVFEIVGIDESELSFELYRPADSESLSEVDY